MKILIIDDNEKISKMLSTFLRLNGNECITASKGRTGLSLIEEQKFDVVLLDLAMPDFSGYDVIDALEKNGTLKQNKIIVFTASNVSQAKLDELVSRGVRDYVLKPIDLNELLEKLKDITKN